MGAPGDPPDHMQAEQRLIFNLNNHAATARVDFLPDGRICWVAGDRSHRWISSSGIVLKAVPTSAHAPTPTRAPQVQRNDQMVAAGTGKLPFGLDNGWKAYGHSYGTPTMSIESGMCVVEGLIKSGEWAQLGHLPVCFQSE